MSTFVLRLKPPRPTVALGISDEEREIMARHAGHRRPYIDSGQTVTFGPRARQHRSSGSGVVKAEDEEEERAFSARDPVVTTRTGAIKIGKMLAGFFRPPRM